MMEPMEHHQRQPWLLVVKMTRQLEKFCELKNSQSPKTALVGTSRRALMLISRDVGQLDAYNVTRSASGSVCLRPFSSSLVSFLFGHLWVRIGSGYFGGDNQTKTVVVQRSNELTDLRSITGSTRLIVGNTKLCNERT